MRVVIDTNVLVAALRSKRGASFRLLQSLGRNVYQPVLSPPLFLEYEDVLRRPGILPGMSPTDIDHFLRYFHSHCVELRVHFLWRPHLRDPKDDMVLEAALAGQASYIVTHNIGDFDATGSLGVRAVTPAEFLRILSSI